MIDYDFSTLNDKEFENLSIDLISKDRDKRFERFKAGKDGGIDGRFYHDDGTQEIVQCKHYLKTGFNGLISSLKKKNDKGINEIDKVNNLSPTKYIFSTSLPLSAENKKTIKELFTPHIKNDNDIYGQEDLNQILGDNPDIVKKYYKLWLSSTVVLDRIFNNAIESRSEFLLEDIKENAKYYVVTENHNKAIEKLEKSHIIIIAGEPGIGKTTLAEHMALWYIEKDFKFYNIENSINEAESIYKRDEKQIFYFDDFLGSNYLKAIEDKKDSHIVKFMDRIKRDKTKRFILTSRTNIFNQGLALSDTFKSKNIENEEFIIKIDSLKDIDKANILYNHIWHSGLDEEFINEIYIEKRYREIIKHKNFNPRLIAFITDNQKITKEKIEPRNYWKYIVEKLDNPQDIWKNTFDKQSDEFVRIIVILTVFNGNKIEENKLRDAYNQYLELLGLQNDSHISKEFDSIIEEVVKYFLNRYKNYKNFVSLKKYDSFDKYFSKYKSGIEVIDYSLFNPSIADFVISKYCKDLNKLLNSYVSLKTVSSLESLKSLYFNKRIEENIYNDILAQLYDEMNINITKGVDYNIQLTYMLIVNCSLCELNQDKIYSFYQDCIDKPRVFSLIDEFITTICFLDNKLLNISNNDFIFQLIDNLNHTFTNDYVYINKLIELLHHLKIKDSRVIQEVNDFIESTLIMELDSELTDLTSDDFDIEVDLKDGGIYFNNENIEDYAEDRLNDLINDINFIEDLNIDKSFVLKNLDISSHDERIMNDYYENYMVEQTYDNEIDSCGLNNIDDIFER